MRLKTNPEPPGLTQGVSVEEVVLPKRKGIREQLGTADFFWLLASLFTGKEGRNLLRPLEAVPMIAFEIAPFSWSVRT